MEFLKSILRLIFVLAKYIFVASSIFLISLSVTTEKFPPPVQEFYQNMQSFRESVHSGPSLAEAVQHRKKFQTNLDAITDGASVKVGDCAADKEKLLKEVGSQKIEIARLQSELDRTRSALLEALARSEKK